MPEDEPMRESPETSPTEAAIESTVEESRADVEQSVRDEGRDDAEVIIERVAALLDERLASVNDRLSAIERTQRDTFANVVQSSAIVSRGSDEVDAAPQPTIDDYDLTI